MAKTLPAGLDAVILADSVGPNGNRLTSFRLTVPKTSLQDLAKHRVDTMGGWEDASMSAASARAIPTQKLLDSDRFWIPPRFFLAHTGMVPTEWVGPDSETLDQRAHYEAMKNTWEAAAWDAVAMAQRMSTGGAAKVHPNRMLEPYLLSDVIYTASSATITNMLNLRDTDEAEYPLALVAGKMRALLEENEPTRLGHGEWHLPMIGPSDRDAMHSASSTTLVELFEEAGLPNPRSFANVPPDYAALAFVSSARCARISFNRHDLILPVVTDLERSLQLGRDTHLVPFEHQNRVAYGSYVVSNLGEGWEQWRKMLPFDRVRTRQTTPTPYERLP
jgi:hypothetical protein